MTTNAWTLNQYICETKLYPANLNIILTNTSNFRKYSAQLNNDDLTQNMMSIRKFNTVLEHAFNSNPNYSITFDEYLSTQTRSNVLKMIINFSHDVFDFSQEIILKEVFEENSNASDFKILSIESKIKNFESVLSELNQLNTTNQNKITLIANDFVSFKREITQELNQIKILSQPKKICLGMFGIRTYNHNLPSTHPEYTKLTLEPIIVLENCKRLILPNQNKKFDQFNRVTELKNIQSFQIRKLGDLEELEELEIPAHNFFGKEIYQYGNYSIYPNLKKLTVSDYSIGTHYNHGNDFHQPVRQYIGAYGEFPSLESLIIKVEPTQFQRFIRPPNCGHDYCPIKNLSLDFIRKQDLPSINKIHIITDIKSINDLQQRQQIKQGLHEFSRYLNEQRIQNEYTVEEN